MRMRLKWRERDRSQECDKGDNGNGDTRADLELSALLPARRLPQVGRHSQPRPPAFRSLTKAVVSDIGRTYEEFPSIFAGASGWTIEHLERSACTGGSSR